MSSKTTKDDSKTEVKPTPTEYDLRNLVLGASELNRGVAHTGSTFRRYGNGHWQDVPDLEIKQIVASTLEAWEYNDRLSLSVHTENNVTNSIKSHTYTKSDAWDRNPEILVFRNCAYDIRTGKKLDHSKEHMATVALPYDYHPGAEADTLHKVLGDLLTDEEARFFQEWAGYCLTTSTKHQIALWLTGPRGGGKSTLITVLETMLGHLSGHLSLSQMGSSFGLSGIVGKTLLTCSETPKQHMKQTDVLNAIITGDTLSINRKYKDPIEHRNTAKLVWAMNSLPNLFDADNGLFRRVKIMEIGKSIPEENRDPEIIDNLRGEGPGTINWALDGLARLNERGKFDYPKSVIRATESYKQENDLAAQFLEECCKRQPSEQMFLTDEYKVYAGQLTDAFNTWAKGHADWSMRALSKEWKRLGLRQDLKPNGKPKPDRNGVAWYGVKLVA